MTRQNQKGSQYNLYENIKSRLKLEERIILDPFLFDFSCQIRALWIMVNLSSAVKNDISQQKMQILYQLLYLSRLSWYQRDKYYSTIDCGLDEDLEQFLQKQYGIQSNSDTITRQLCHEILSDLRDQLCNIPDIQDAIKNDYQNHFSGDWCFKRDHSLQPYVQNFVSIMAFVDLVKANNFPILLMLRHDYRSCKSDIGNQTIVKQFYFRGLQILGQNQILEVSEQDFILTIETRSQRVECAENQETQFEYDFFLNRDPEKMEQIFRSQINLQEALLCLGANHEQFLKNPSTKNNNNIFNHRDLKLNQNHPIREPTLSMEMKQLLDKFQNQSKVQGVNPYDLRNQQIQETQLNIPLQFIHIWASKKYIIEQDLISTTDKN